ncbi:hypothetical protein [Bacillus capparidis]|uniref:Uncharacterized protein n=1 Tax=Bacillus capparidis TaxID=1840411 RepID=A0ABS4CWP2_9BACI|nr:hypothetical protein [Bacillus capparidis]MBP1081979.1 hypothetical protein [Bacillus capparidis]MED1096616.1 hypothetical protein [Bacillus capparidis]
MAGLRSSRQTKPEWSVRIPTAAAGITANARQELVTQWGEAEDEAAQKEILAELNKTIYDELPFEKVSNLSTLDARTSKLQDYEDWYGPRFWNTWKSK